MQNIQLAIPNPCHENWNNMHPTEQGRFCDVCAKQVIDFSVMTDIQLLNYFSKIKDENICGRAYPDQLNRAIAAPEEIKKRKFSYWNYIALFLLFFAKLSGAKAQRGKITVQEKPVKIHQNSPTVINGEVAPVRHISGQVIDEKGNLIPYATIIIAETKQVKNLPLIAKGNLFLA